MGYGPPVSPPPPEPPPPRTIVQLRPRPQPEQDARPRKGRRNWSMLIGGILLAFLPVSEWIKHEQNVRLRSALMIHSGAIKARLEWIEIQLGTPLHE
jgi:hypothetical protein